MIELSESYPYHKLRLSNGYNGYNYIFTLLEGFSSEKKFDKTDLTFHRDKNEKYRLELSIWLGCGLILQTSVCIASCVCILSSENQDKRITALTCIKALECFNSAQRVKAKWYL